MHALSLALVLAAAPAGAAPAPAAPAMVTEEASRPGPAVAPVPVTAATASTSGPAASAPPGASGLRLAAAPVPQAAVEKMGQGDRAFLAGDYRSALFSYQDAVYLAPGSAAARVKLGRAYLALRYPPQATAQAEQALALDPDSADARKLLDDARAAPPRPAGPAAVLAAVRTGAPPVAAASTPRVYRFADPEAPASRIAAPTSSATTAPAPTTTASAAGAPARTALPAATTVAIVAASPVAAAAAVAPDPDPAPIPAHAAAQLVAPAPSAGPSAAAPVVPPDPGGPTAAQRYRAALVLLANREFDKAAGELTQAIVQDPRLAVAYAARASARFGLGRYREAADDYQAALALDASLGTPLYGLAECYRVLGDGRRASEMYERYADSSASDVREDLRAISAKRAQELR